MSTNLHFIKSVNIQTISSTVQITDCFSDAYEVYKIVLTDFSTDSSSNYGQTRFINSGGSTITSSNYCYAYQSLGSAYAPSDQRVVNATYLRGIGGQDVRSQAFNGNAVIYVYNPTSTTSYTRVTSQSAYWNSGNNSQGYKSSGILKTFDDVTGIEFFYSSGNVDEFRATVYGVKG